LLRPHLGEEGVPRGWRCKVIGTVQAIGRRPSAPPPGVPPARMPGPFESEAAYIFSRFSDFFATIATMPRCHDFWWHDVRGTGDPNPNFFTSLPRRFSRYFFYQELMVFLNGFMTLAMKLEQTSIPNRIKNKEILSHNPLDSTVHWVQDVH